MKRKKVNLTNLLKIKNLNSKNLINFYQVLIKDFRIFRILILKLEFRITELEKDITIANYRSALYKRLNKYLVMNKQVFFNYKFVHNKLKIKKNDLSLISDDYLQDIRNKIHDSWKIIRYASTYDYPYSVFMRRSRRFNIFDKHLVVILELLLITFDLNKVRRKIKKIMDKLSIKISIYLRQRTK